ncbi:MAG: divalent-cation tolerance protein CutA [Synechococcus sp.]
MSGFLQVSTTTSSQADAQQLAGLVLEKRLAACVQISGPISSQYWWQGGLETSTEWLCMIKTSSRLYPELESVLLASHPYETPEIIAIPIFLGSPGYLNWLDSQLKAPDEPMEGNRLKGDKCS